MMIDVRPAQQRVERLLDQRSRVGRSMFDVASSRIRIRGSASERAGDRDQLALARREARAALADDVVEPVLEPGGDPVDADRARGRGDLLVGRVRAAEADVVGDRAAEEERILEHDAELAAVASAARTSRRSVPSTRTAPSSRVVEARDQLRGRRLAAARLADERDAAAGRARRSSIPWMTGSSP